MGKKEKILLGADVGFGMVKALSNHTKEVRTMPSVAIKGKVPPARKMDRKEIDWSKLIVETDEGIYFVGEHALNIPEKGVSKRTQERDRSKDTISRILFQTTIGLSVPDEDGSYHVQLVTGLPNTDYDKEIAKNLEEFLDDTFTITFHINKEMSITKKIKVEVLEVLRQPEGTYYYDLFTFDKERLMAPKQDAKSYVGIIDIGHFTTDYLLFIDGKMIEDESTMGSTIAATEVYDQMKRKIGQYFEEELGYDFVPTDRDLDQAAVKGTVFYTGEHHDVSHIVKETAENVSESIAKQVLDTWGNEVNRTEGIIATGGGANLLGEALVNEFKKHNKQAFVVPKDAQLANVMGFYMYGIASIREEETDIYERYIEPVIGNYED